MPPPAQRPWVISKGALCQCYQHTPTSKISMRKAARVLWLRASLCPGVSPSAPATKCAETGALGARALVPRGLYGAAADPVMRTIGRGMP
jgi:hypothetical protein